MTIQQTHRKLSLTLLLLVVQAIALSVCSTAGAADSSPSSNTTQLGAERHSFSVERAPTWVLAADQTLGTQVFTEPVHYRIFDEQVLLDGSTQRHYVHQVRSVNSSAGLEVASQIEANFEPSFQDLAIHHLDILRGGKRINRLDRQRVKLLQRETQLEQQLYNGVVTASIVLDDVRVGDQIDFAYSISGANPVFGGRFADRVWMRGFRGPMAQYRYRLLIPKSRSVAHRVGSPDITVESSESNDRRELVFRRLNVSQFVAEEGTPWRTMLADEIQLSEFTNWADVSRWGRNLFAEGNESTPLVDAKAAEIRAQSAEPLERLLRALQTVQSEVRYFGTEIGPYSHRPATPEKVLTQRFGDCKDKVMLLTALLRRLDISATPTLVSYRLKGSVAEIIPGPFAFDHVIARVNLGGKTYWLDPTRSQQTGPVERRQVTGFRSGLPLTETNSALAELPSAANELKMVVRDRFTISAFPNPVELESRVTYRGDLAEGARDGIAANGTGELAKQLSDAHIRLYPKMKSVAPIHVENEADDNAITIVQQFSIPDFWTFPEQTLLTANTSYWSFVDILRFPGQGARQQSYSLAPGKYFHHVLIRVRDDIGDKPVSQHFEESDSHISFKNDMRSAGREAEYKGVLQVFADEVLPSAWQAYTDKVLSAAGWFDLYLRVSAIPINQLESVKKELAGLADAIKRKKVKATTKHQELSLIKSALLTRQIEAGRLSPELRSQALGARGVTSDHLGNTESAKVDFEAALALTPDSPDRLNEAAVNALLLDDSPRAIKLADRVLAIRPNDIDARYTRARAKFFARDYQGAKAEFESLLKDRAAIRNGYALLYLSLAARHLGQDGRDLILPSVSELGETWPRPLIDMTIGKLSEDAVLKAAKVGDSSREQLCEAYYYLGAGFLAAGDKRRAREYFRKSIDQEVTEYIEDRVSRNELAKLDHK